MQAPLQIVFRNMAGSAAIEAKIRVRAGKLEKRYGRIVSCRVVVEERHRHHRHGNLYQVRVDLKVPGEEIVASRDRSADQAHEDIYVAIRDAFAAARRQLDDRVRQRRGDVKAHVPAPRGRVIERHPDYGRIETSEGHIVYFHRNSVIEGSFDALEVGTEVHFVEQLGEFGPQASTVRAPADARRTGK